MTALPEWDTRYVLVSRPGGQQLKKPAQLDRWLRDGSAAYVESLLLLGNPMPSRQGDRKTRPDQTTNVDGRIKRDAEHLSSQGGAFGSRGTCS